MAAQTVLYNFPSFLIALVLLALMLATIRIGLALGRRRHDRESADSKSHASAVQGSLLGLLALLLGFTFSMALGRHDARSAAVVEESNAIGTAYLRLELLSEPRRTAALPLLRRYADLRVAASAVPASDIAGREALVREAEASFESLWQIAVAEARETPTPVAMGVAAALNDMIDALASRDAAIERHVPELVILLMASTFLLLGAVVGYSSAISNVRPGVPVYVLMMLIVILVFLIIDLDRPRRGLIQVDQSRLAETAAAMVRG